MVKFSGLALLVFLVACSSESPPASSGGSAGAEPAQGTTAPPATDAALPEAGAAGGDAGTPTQGGAAPPMVSSPFPHEKQYGLEGNVRFTLLGNCRGCQAGSLEATSKVKGSDIWLTGKVSGCGGPCIKLQPAEGDVTVRGLKRREYTIHASHRITKVTPLSLGAAKRGEWALMLLREDCSNGLASLTGNERVTKELREAVNVCLGAVPEDRRFKTISAMMNWKNSKAFVPGLIKALDDAKVAYLAARVLGRTKDRRAVGPLIKVVTGDGDKALRWDAARSLRLITKQDHGEDAAAWRAWYSKNASRYPSP